MVNIIFVLAGLLILSVFLILAFVIKTSRLERNIKELKFKIATTRQSNAIDDLFIDWIIPHFISQLEKKESKPEPKKTPLEEAITELINVENTDEFNNPMERARFLLREIAIWTYNKLNPVEAKGTARGKQVRKLALAAGIINEAK